MRPSTFKGLWTAPPKIDPNTFIVWEPCSKSHGEIVPGYASYFLELGFEVVVMLTPARLDEGLFARFSHPKLRLACMSQSRIRRFMKSGRAAQAAGVIVTTAGKLPKRADLRPDVAAVFGSEPPNTLLFVEHDAKARIEAQSWDHTTLTLAHLNYKKARSTVVNPHDFGTVETTPKSPKTRFLMVGAARARRRNQNLIFASFEALLQKGQDNFELILVGKKGRDHIPDALKNHVKEVGKVDYPTLYTQVENADFILTALQPDNDAHSFYRTTGTSGSFQLCYGFSKPCIVQKDFATNTALTAKNSLLYESDDELTAALARACEMSAGDYGALSSQLNKDAKALYASSLKALKGALTS